MTKKSKFRDIWLSLSILAVLLVSVTLQGSSDNKWLTKTSQNDSLTGQNSSANYLSQSVGYGFESTPFPSATTSSDSCTSCDAVDMKVLSVTLTAISKNPNKTSTPSVTNNLPISLIVFGIVLSIALIVLLFLRVILPKINNRVGSEFRENETKQSNQVEKGKDHAE